MNVIKFKENSQPSKEHIVFCIVDETNSLKENKEIIKTISDWTIQNITIQGYTVLVSTDEDALLKSASSLSATHAVVLSTGTEFINGYKWFDVLEEFCQEDFFVAGHILDRKDAYYELHHQCYIVNLNYYKQVREPRVGKMNLFCSHTQSCPQRSDENIHDDYTPLWVCSGTSTTQYQHQAHGWNIISTALNNNLKIKVFNNALRDNKIYYYPDYDSYFDQLNFLYARQGFCNGMAIYLGNSESNINVNIGIINQLVVPASGLNWLEYLNSSGYHNGTIVKFYDYSYLTLEYIKALINTWNGEDYSTFALNYFNQKFNFINANLPYCGDLNNNINPTVWKKIISTVKFEFYLIDLLDTTKDLQWIDNVPETLINLTNIFNYIGTATVRSVKDRVRSENSFITKLQDRVPNAHVIFTRRAADGFVESVQNVAVPAKDLQLTNIEDLKKPTWHLHDWSLPPG